MSIFHYEYLPFDGAELFTVVCLTQKDGKYPTVICRNPYVDSAEGAPEAEDFDEILRHPDRDDPFWHTRFGGGEAHEAIKNAGIPILLVTGFYDIYTGGVFDMWRGLYSEQTTARVAENTVVLEQSYLDIPVADK